MPVDSWDFIQQKIGPIMTKDLKAEIDEYRSMKKTELDFTERSDAESLADLHKVRRFLYYEAEEESELKAIGYLDLAALDLGFEEQKQNKKFDGGPVMEDIKTCFEQFTRPFIEYTKPSHGMILVSILLYY